MWACELHMEKLHRGYNGDGQPNPQRAFTLFWHPQAPKSMDNLSILRDVTVPP
jgi:hypothetical protein